MMHRVEKEDVISKERRRSSSHVQFENAFY